MLIFPFCYGGLCGSFREGNPAASEQYSIRQIEPRRPKKQSLAPGYSKESNTRGPAAMRATVPVGPIQSAPEWKIEGTVSGRRHTGFDDDGGIYGRLG